MRPPDASTDSPNAAASRPTSAGARELDRKLDAALEDSFPSSDSVSFVEACPLEPTNHDLPAVKATNGQQHAKVGKSTSGDK